MNFKSDKFIILKSINYSDFLGKPFKKFKKSIKFFITEKFYRIFINHIWFKNMKKSHRYFKFFDFEILDFLNEFIKDFLIKDTTSKNKYNVNQN